MNAPLLLGLATLAASAVGAAPTGPVVYAPDVVGVDRLFMVALKVAPDAPDVGVSVPESVVLLDRTRLPTQADVRRFYFRAVKPAKRAEIRFALPGGEVTVPVEIWSFEDLRRFRDLKGTPLPRRWPLGKPIPELKERQVFPTGAEAKAPTGEEKGGWLDVPDDAIWEMQPDSAIPRWHWVNLQYGCPVHGTEIYKHRAYYPWGKDTALPYRWKIRCPVGGEEYPGNDFAAGDFTNGAFPDDGIGGGYVRDGRHYGFIAELAQAYAHQMLRVPEECAARYVASGDARYVHKALVAFCRLAVEYAYLATMTQHRHRNGVSQVERFGQGRFDEGPILRGSGLTVYAIDQPTYQMDLARAYDRIFPAIEKDAEIVPYLRKKGFDVKTHADVRRFIEENLMAVWVQAAMDGATFSNPPYPQLGLLKMAEVLNYAQGSDFMDWLYDGAGNMRIFVPNTYFRDGAPYESTGGYNGAHVAYLAPIVDAIEHLRRMRPEVYPGSKYPPLGESRRYHNVFDFAMDTVTIDRGFPNVGDTGTWPAYKKLPRITWQNGDAAAFEHAYRLLRDPKFAWALAHAPGWKPSPDFPFTREEIEEKAKEWPDDWNDRSSLHDGYGIAILRSGAGDDKRALWMNYGHNRNHSQDDTLDIGLQAYQGVLLSHMGYPRNWGWWEKSWSSHYVARQFPYQTMVAQCQLFADAGPVQVAEARGTSLDEPEQQWQRRLLALVDVGPDAFYCVDLHRVFGGDEQWWAFHGQEGDFTTHGIPLTSQKGGTLAGPDVPYGDEKWLEASGCTHDGTYGWQGVLFPFAHLYNVERARPDGPWWADWALKNGDGLHLRLTMPAAEGVEVNLCDGTSPAGGHPYEMKWILLHNKGQAPAKTQVVSLLEPYMNTPLIREARALRLSGDDEGFAPVGCEVHLDGRTDTILASADPGAHRTAEGGLEFAGRFVFHSEKEGVPVAMSLVGGTLLRKGEHGVRLESPEYRAKITRIDRATETLTVSPAPPVPAALVGAYAYITSPGRRVGRKVLGVEPVPGGARLRLDLDSRIGTGRVTGVDNFAVKTDTPFILQGYRYYLGARLVNADRTAEYRITEAATQKAALIDQEAHPEATAARLAKEFPGDTWFEVYDYGVGDEVVYPHRVSVVRAEDGAYTVEATAEVTVDLPAGARVRQR
ncbi:MAG: hypothetical protein HY321_09480 [Armatimonadetes bacterium]|nr:hypothetical protein [Armatimonadota bacterium]